MRSSNESSLCRLDWQPSRLQVGALVALGGLASIAIGMSAMPRLLSLALAVGALAHGLVLARGEFVRPRSEIWLRPADASARLNFPAGSQSWSEVRIRLRGPMACLSGIDAGGRRRRLHWWPDTLPAHARRELRLAAGRLRPPPKSMPSLIF